MDLTKKQKQIMLTLYEYGSLSTAELALNIQSSVSSLSNILNNFHSSDFIFRERKGKFVYSSLTDLGKKYTEKNLLFAPSSQVQRSHDDFSALQIFLSYLFSNVNIEACNGMARCLYEMDMGVICTHFSLAEFLFLAFQTGLLTDESFDPRFEIHSSQISLLSLEEQLLCQKKFLALVQDKYFHVTMDDSKVKKKNRDIKADEI